MKEFGWTIEYTLNLTYPVFLELFGLIHRVRMDAAIDQFYMPYGAAKYGGKCSKLLFEGRGSMHLGKTNSKQHEHEEITPEMIEKANDRFRKIIEERRKKAAEVIAGA